MMALSKEDFDALVAKRVAEIKQNHKKLVAQKTKELRREREARPPLRDDQLFTLPTVQLDTAPLRGIDAASGIRDQDHEMQTLRESSSDSILDGAEPANSSTHDAANCGTAGPMTTTSATDPADDLSEEPSAPRRVVRASFITAPKNNAEPCSVGTSSTPAAPVVRDNPALTVAQARAAAMGHIRKKVKIDNAVQEDPPKAVTSSSTVGDSLAASRHFEQGTIPDWYEKAKKPKQPGAEVRKTWDQLRNLGVLIAKCQQVQTKGEQRENWRILYQEIDNLRFTDVTPFGLKKSKVFDKDLGLPQLYDKRFSKGAQYPFYVVSDAKSLHKKWLAGILDGSNMFRGIKGMIKTRESNGMGQSIDEAFKLEWKFFGDGHLVSGDWFANQLCAVRDGAHGSPQGGISGLKELGATSISLSGDMYIDADRDELDNIWYSGTPQTKIDEKEPTINTKLLLRSEETKQPVRVLRSMHLPKTNPYKPIRGFRYDGLYEVQSHRLHDPRRYHYVFHLVRLPGQDPIRYKGVEIRPTQKEIDTYDHEMRMFGKKKG